MSIAGVLRNRLLWLCRLISTCFRRAVDCVRYGRKGAPRIGELPYVRSKEEREQFVGSGGEVPSPNQSHQSYQSHQQNNSAYGQQPTTPTDSWNTWDDRTFGIETKIAEYRQQVQQQKHPVKEKEKVEDVKNDLFSDLQPKLKAAKTYRVQDPVANAIRQAPRQSLFEVKEMDPFANRVG